MAYVILRTGKVLQYNKGQAVSVSNGCIDVWTGEDNKYLCARFPLDVVERVEFERPCEVLRAKSFKSAPVYEV
jgi:hypothetical protein